MIDKEFRKEAMSLYKAPFTYYAGYIHDNAGNMFADQGRAEEASALMAARVRGWGRLSYMKDGDKLQDEVGNMIAEALNEYWSKYAS